MMQVGIICGGFSSEYDISVKSATTILDNFPSGYKPYLIHLSSEGWKIEIDGEKFSLDERDFTFSHNDHKSKIDLAIVFIHGDPGENGKVQAYLEMKGVPYVNSGPLASELSFDKWFCNQFLKGFGINVAVSIYLTSKENELDGNKIADQLGLPLFVKPCDSGSSYGISKANFAQDIIPAIDLAFNEGKTVIVEGFLDGIEVTCGLYRSNQGIITLPLTEISTQNDFFDYEAKYEGLSEEITPARISDIITKKVQEISIEIYQLLQLRSIARIDFMLVDNIPFVIEVNTIPGFSAESIIPKMIKESGNSISEVWSQILKVEVA